MTDPSAVKNQPMGKAAPFTIGEQLFQIAFYLFRIIAVGKSQTAGDPFAVCVYDDSRLTEGMGQDHIGGFSADSRQTYQLLESVRNFTLEIVDHFLRAAL